MSKRKYERTDKKSKRVTTVHSQEEKKDDGFLSSINLFRRREEPKSKRTVKLKRTDSDLVAWHLALLTPTPSEPEQLIVMEEKNGKFRPLYTETGERTFVKTDGDEVKVYTEAKPRSLIEIHTHPRWTTPSQADVQVLVEFDSVKESYIMTPKKDNEGNNIVYAMRKKRLSARRKRRMGKFDQKQFDQDWEQSQKDAVLEIQRLEKANLEWFPGDPNLQISSAKNREFAIKLKAIQLLGVKYGFVITAWGRDSVILPKELER